MLLYSPGRLRCHRMGTSVELALNLAWLAISAGLGTVFLLSRIRHEGVSTKCTYGRSTAWIAYLLLVAFLLPAISMTDDLMAMTAPADREQVVRRYEAMAVAQSPVLLHVASFFGAREIADSIPGFIAFETVLLPSFLYSQLPFSRQGKSRAPPTVG